MREILFRGKTESGKWCYGDLITADWYSNEETYILQLGQQCQVIEKTVGQYTGLTDKNGKKMFEGDIVDVAYDIDYGGIAAERIGIFKVIFNDGCFMKRNKTGLFHFIPSDKCKVIGNIHENPELLKEV